MRKFVAPFFSHLTAGPAHPKMPFLTPFPWQVARIFFGGNRRMNHQAVLLTATQTASPLDPGTPQNIMKLLSFAMKITIK
jgi:hypothetical protein